MNYGAIARADENLGKIRVKSAAPELADMPESPGRIAEAIRKDRDNPLYLEVKERVTEDTMERYADDIEMANERAAIQGEGNEPAPSQKYAWDVIEYDTLKQKINENRWNISKERIKEYEKGIDYNKAKSKLLKLIEDNSEAILKNSYEEVRLSKSSVGKLLSVPAVRKSLENGFTRAQHNAAAANIDLLFKNSTKMLSRQDRQGDLHVKAIHRYASPIFGDNAAFITVKETVEGGKKAYSIELILEKELEGKLEEADLTRLIPLNSSSFENNVSRPTSQSKPGGESGDGTIDLSQFWKEKP